MIELLVIVLYCIGWILTGIYIAVWEYKINNKSTIIDMMIIGSITLFTWLWVSIREILRCGKALRGKT